MRTIIRLQRHGPMNAFFYKLVAAGSYKRLRGKPVEHLGFYYPHKINEHGRSIILNKSRIRYWLANGVVLSKKVQRFLSFVGMAAEPWIPFGKSTVYKDPHKTHDLRFQGFRRFFSRGGLFNKHDKAYIEGRKADDENLIIRKIKFQQRIRDYFEVKDADKLVEDILSQGDKDPEDDSTFIRTQKFRILQEFYRELEIKSPLLSPLKRELLHKKMNELVSKGLMDEQVFKEEKAKMDSPAQKKLEQAMLLKYENRKQMLEKNIDYFDSLMHPITESDFASILKQRTQFPEKILQKKIDQYLTILKKSQNTPTLLDVERFISLHITLADKAVKSENNRLVSNKQTVGVSRYPLTPVPNLAEYDPNDWYDLTQNHGNAIQNKMDPKEDHLFNIPLTREHAEKRERDRANWFSSLLRDEFLSDDENEEINKRHQNFILSQKRRRKSKPE